MHFRKKFLTTKQYKNNFFSQNEQTQQNGEKGKALSERQSLLRLKNEFFNKYLKNSERDPESRGLKSRQISTNHHYGKPKNSFSEEYRAKTR